MAESQSRREFLIGASTALALPRRLALLSDAVLIDADAMLLAELTPWDRELVEQCMANHPGLTAARALQALLAAGM